MIDSCTAEWRNMIDKVGEAFEITGGHVIVIYNFPWEAITLGLMLKLIAGRRERFSTFHVFKQCINYRRLNSK